MEEPPPPAAVGSACWVSSGPERCLSAAFVQCFAVVAMCVAVADPSWIEVHEMNRTGQDCCVFGVAYVLHLAGNFTYTGPYLFNHIGITLMIVMATCCYLSILMGLLAFLLDFLLMKTPEILGVKIGALLHVFTALSSATAVAMCSCLFVIILDNAEEEPSQQSDFIAAFGESFFFAIFSFIMSVFAAVLSFHAGSPLRSSHLVRNIFLLDPKSLPKMDALPTGSTRNFFSLSSRSQKKRVTFKMP